MYSYIWAATVSDDQDQQCVNIMRSSPLSGWFCEVHTIDAAGGSVLWVTPLFGDGGLKENQ